MFKKRLFSMTVFLSAAILLSALTFSTMAKDKKDMKKNKKNVAVMDEKTLQNRIDKINTEAKIKVAKLQLENVVKQDSKDKEKEIKKLTSEIGELQGKLLQIKVEHRLLNKDNPNNKWGEKKDWGQRARRGFGKETMSHKEMGEGCPMMSGPQGEKNAPPEGGCPMMNGDQKPDGEKEADVDHSPKPENRDK